MQTPPSFASAVNPARLFKLLVVYRWASLIPPLLFLLADSRFQFPVGIALAAAVAATLTITFFPLQLNRWLERQPLLLAVDVVFCAALITATGGARSPYYLYSLSPVLAAAFFFHVRGALIAAAGSASLFAGVLFAFGSVPDWTPVMAQIVGYFLIGGVFGYQPTLIGRLTTARDELERAHRDLQVIHDLTVSLQNAADVREVEERVLAAVTDDLGFQRAVIALVDQNDHVITSWLGNTRAGRPLFASGMPHPARVPLTPDSGVIAQCLLDGRPRLSIANLRTPDQQLNSHLSDGVYHVFPMLLREHAVGVLLVDAGGEDDSERLLSLEPIASQAAVAVGTTLLCIDRAQRLAVQEERIRIAREIHDTVSQSLFGLVYSLGACVKLLPAQPDIVKQELQELQQLAEATRVEVRQSILDIYPTEITAERFAADLHKYVSETCGTQILTLNIQVRGEFEKASPRLRRSLYRIAQEALNNTIHHAAAQSANLCLEIANGQAALSIRDDGRGFNPAVSMAREYNREHFGLRGIQDRVASLGGWCEISSQPGAGAMLLVSVPIG